MIVFLTGPAAAGKSTVAKAFQKAQARNGAFWVCMDLDDFAKGISFDWYGLGAVRGPHAERGLVYVKAKDGALTMKLGDDLRRAFGAFRAGVLAVAQAGVNVICAASLVEEQDWAAWGEIGAAHPVIRVGLMGPVDELERREKADATRLLKGLARGNYAIYDRDEYDLRIDTTLVSAKDAAQLVAELLP